MSFHITVRRLADPPAPEPPDSADLSLLNTWLTECAAGEVYENPLGAGHIVYQWWHLPAQRLTLPLLSRVYHDGLTVSGSDLERLSSELDALERDWLTSELEAEPPLHWTASHNDGSKTQGDTALRDHLRQRANYLRQAIEAARNHTGVISIG